MRQTKVRHFMHVGINVDKKWTDGKSDVGSYQETNKLFDNNNTCYSVGQTSVFQWLGYLLLQVVLNSDLRNVIISSCEFKENTLRQVFMLIRVKGYEWKILWWQNEDLFEAWKKIYNMEIVNDGFGKNTYNTTYFHIKGKIVSKVIIFHFKFVPEKIQKKKRLLLVPLAHLISNPLSSLWFISQ